MEQFRKSSDLMGAWRKYAIQARQSALDNLVLGAWNMVESSYKSMPFPAVVHGEQVSDVEPARIADSIDSRTLGSTAILTVGSDIEPEVTEAARRYAALVTGGNPIARARLRLRSDPALIERLTGLKTRP